MRRVESEIRTAGRDFSLVVPEKLVGERAFASVLFRCSSRSYIASPSIVRNDVRACMRPTAVPLLALRAYRRCASIPSLALGLVRAAAQRSGPHWGNWRQCLRIAFTRPERHEFGPMRPGRTSRCVLPLWLGLPQAC